MGCNCGKSSTPKKKFVYTDPQGKKTTYDTEIQARAAQIRHGGSWVAQPA